MNVKKNCMEFFAELYYYFYQFFSYEDDKIYGCWMTYRASCLMDDPGCDTWYKLASDWSEEDTALHYYNFPRREIDNIDDVIRSKPDCVTDLILHVKYYKRNKKWYKAIKDPKEFTWPHKRKGMMGMSFGPFIQNAWCGTPNNPKKINITKVIKKLAGPRSDFHCSDATFSDVIKYDEPLITVEYSDDTKRECNEDDKIITLI